MTTPTSALGMSHIQTEFGGSNPIALSEYYGVNANVASSGQIRMAQFLGISAIAAADVQNKTVYDMTFSLSTNARSIHWTSNGVCQCTGDATSTYTWRDSGASSDFEIRATKVAGTEAPSFSSGWSNNTWAAMSSDRHVFIFRNSMSYYTCNVKIEIRWAANGTIIDTGYHELIDDVKK